MNDFLQHVGLQGDVLFAGFAGGVVRAITQGYTSIRQVITAPVAGALCAGYLTHPILHYIERTGIHLPPTTSEDTTVAAASFLVGVSGMWIVEKFTTLVEKRLGLLKEEDSNGK